LICSELGAVPLEQEAFNHYNKNTMSIEVLKDDSLQKINFRVKNKVPGGYVRDIGLYRLV